MKRVLYAIQGTGNGHVSRARTLIPLLQTVCHVDVLLSGTESNLELPFNITHRFNGLSFCAGKKGGIDYWKTFKKSNLRGLYADIKRLPIDDYDLVLNDFEPVSAWACRLRGIPCIGLSHQQAVIHTQSPKPVKNDWLGKWVLEHFAPANLSFGFHFKAYAPTIFTPVIRTDLLNVKPKNHGHYCVYLPAYTLNEIKPILYAFPEIEWHIFTTELQYSYREKNLRIFPVNYQQFMDSLLYCAGILCGAGFETPAEALYLKKKLMVIPMKGQYEQQCNAAALATLGVPVLKRLRKKHIPLLQEWIDTPQTIRVEYPQDYFNWLQEILAMADTLSPTPSSSVKSVMDLFSVFTKKQLKKVANRYVL